MAKLGLERDIVDDENLERAIAHCASQGVLLPTLAQLADPTRIPDSIQQALLEIDPDSAHPLNLFRVHWYNGLGRTGCVSVPAVLEFPSELTGVPARIVLLLGHTFPMVGAHKVLAAYGCLAPRIVTGQFDPTRHRAVWPSTGNYCRGGVAISRIMGCRSVAVLPEEMSRERFEWLERWVERPEDVIRTPGTESNVKEIYDRCRELDCEPDTVIFNQFCEFGNHLIHALCTGGALERVVEDLQKSSPGLRPAAFVSATGSAGTLGAGERLKDLYGTRIVAVEALECPTLLYNGYGEHNIQGIGDKHVPLIHNVTRSDLVVGISDEATDSLAVLFAHPAGQRFLVERKGLAPSLAGRLAEIGLSGICNLLAAIKTARRLDLGPEDLVLSVATDGSDLYGSEIEKVTRDRLGGRVDGEVCAEIYGAFLRGLGTDHVLELTHVDRNRIFNLGYFTWVEQQGVSFDDFEARRDQRFWRNLRDLVPAWDGLIEDFNARTGVVSR